MPPPDKETPISEASTDQLLRELKMRHDACFFIGLNTNSDGEEIKETTYRGGHIVCVGLIEYARHQMLAVGQDDTENV